MPVLFETHRSRSCENTEKMVDVGGQKYSETKLRAAKLASRCKFLSFVRLLQCWSQFDMENKYGSQVRFIEGRPNVLYSDLFIG
ncbi:hypothetical protein TcWFU_010139 [Taenia crassiceps]|uniref:Uncharacterized protein n=1 Tax=Taenia crassiceps TaxID=6207 RepID=A0ABR4QMX3_9CEST